MARPAPDRASEGSSHLSARPPRVVAAGEVVRATVAADVARLISNDPAARLGDEPEGVHQARVATRRLRSNLDTFSPMLRAGGTEAVASELQWLGRRLGVVRDLDVLQQCFAKAVRGFDPREREDAFVVLDALGRRRAEEAAALHRRLEAKRYERLLRRLGSLVAAPPLRRMATAPASPFLTEVLYDRFAALETAVAALPTLPEDAQLHVVRKTAKPLRYVAEAAAPVLGEGCGRLARSTTALCDELGALNDGARAIQWLESVHGVEHSAAAQRLRSGEVLRMADARAAWTARWAEVCQAAGGLSFPLGAAPGG